MQQKNRSAIVISALLTTMVMTLIAGGLLIYSGMLPLTGANAQGSADQQSQTEAPIVVTVQPVLVPALEQAQAPVLEMAQAAPVPAQSLGMGPEEVAAQIEAAIAAQSAADAETITAYQTQLEQTYQALQEAYTQIATLQTAQQTQIASAGTRYDGDENREHDDD